MPDKKTKFLRVSVTDDEGNMLSEMVAAPKDFSSGSKGFYVNGKFVDQNDPTVRYTFSAPIVIIGSKPKK